MATREENLKKINEQLEQLDDEQLEKITGGLLFLAKPADDNQFDQLVRGGIDFPRHEKNGL